VRRRLVPTIFGLVLLAILVGVRGVDPYPVQALRDIAFDFYQRLAPREQAIDYPVRIVDVDEASLAELGQWPWPRNLLATLTDRLSELGAAAIAFDFLFPEPDRLSPRRIGAEIPGIDASTLADNDELFAQALGFSRSVVGFADAPGGAGIPVAKGGFSISGTNPIDAVPRLGGATMPLPAFTAAAAGLGAVSLAAEDAATLVRRLPLVWSDGEHFLPALPVEALRVTLEVQDIVVLGETDAPFVEGLRVGQFSIPTTANGELWLYYRPPDRGLYVSAKDVLADGYPALGDRIAGHIVLVGTSASGLFDIVDTTLGTHLPGVAVHAQALEQILQGAFLTRSDQIAGIEIVGFALVGVLLVLVVLNFGPIFGLLAGGLSIGLAAAFSWYAFRSFGWMVDPSYPIVGLTLLYLALVFFQFLITDTDKRQIRRAFGYYVAPALLQKIERSADTLKLGGEMRELTVMFSDVRGFTPLSERLPPSRIVTLLNILFSALGGRIVAEMGTIDKFIGDAIMAFWNAPVDVPAHARRACLAALGMRERLAALNAGDAFAIRHAGIDRQEIMIGIGIATGPALVGNLGLETRFDYSCIGDTVNTASRVEGACKSVGYDIVVTDETRAAASDLAFLAAGAIALKGKAHPVPIHILVGDKAMAESPAFLALEAEHGKAVAALLRGADATAIAARCTELCRAVEPGLLAFYELLPRRAEDFPAPIAPAAYTPDRIRHQVSAVSQ
jgi:adenylate cyclase